MAHGVIGEQPVFLSTVSVEHGHRRLALTVTLLSLLVFVVAAPFSRVPLPQVWAFMPVYQSALVINDLITAVLLFAQFNNLGTRALLVLACGYLFTAVMAIVHLLTFPGVFSATGLLGAGPQTTAWLYMFWHGVFPLTVIAYAVLKERIAEAQTRPRSYSHFAIASGVTIVLTMAYAAALLATMGQQILPTIMRGNNYTSAMIVVVVTVWMLSLVALLMLWMRRPHSRLDTWLMVVMCAWMIDVALSAVLNSGRFDLGFYVGRTFGLLASTFVLAVLLLEMVTLYARLAQSLELEQQERKRETEERRRVFETSLDLILVTDRHGSFIRVSPSSAAILGYQPDEMIGHSAVEFIHRDDLDPTRNEMRSARLGRETRNFETRYVHKDGRDVTLAWTGVWSEPEQRHYFIGRDMTEAKKAEEKLKYLAHYDQLTGLPNRVSLQAELKELIDSDAGTERRPTSIAMLDLDGFKDINDTLGHSIGDQLLKAAAQRLITVASDRGRVYRLGGDEFVAVFPGCADPRPVAEIIDAMLGRLAERFEINGQTLFIGASAGIAIAPTDGSNVEELMANVDLALYEAKAQGGRTYRLFLPVLRARAEARRELDSELRRAFSENEFELFFQPQLRLSDGAVAGAEALLRWRHPERGILGPGAFIEALGESAVVRDVGNWIIRTACQASVAWRTLGLSPIRIGVNLFPAQFHHESLLAEIEDILLQSGLPADALELEITENIGLNDDGKVLAPLTALRNKGVHLAFDDFGTGYASLSYLTRYPLSRIKIDQSFVRKISDSLQDTAIIRSIIVMAHNLGLAVTAEGVETPAQAAFLRAEGCDEVQGFLYAKPRPNAEFVEFLRSNTIDSQRAGGRDRQPAGEPIAEGRAGARWKNQVA
jgi:diguanylate cyclase (GGDEF)-like protein/PAS domain S-box-containing protein